MSVTEARALVFAGNGDEVSGGAGPIEIAPLTTLAEFERCVELQVAVWGYEAGDLIPRRVFLVAERIGGQVLGAFAGEGAVGDPARMVGFAMGLPGYRSGRAYLHSHMLAVLPAYRNAGLGRRLKLAQRSDALKRGFGLMEWTFDPLEIKNAYLNLHRLGAICLRYQEDFYGPSSSPLQGGLPTDRLYAEWWLRSDHVTRSLAGETDEIDVRRRVEVSGSVYAWKQDPERRALALRAQQELRAQLRAGFMEGLAAIGYERDADGNGRYLLGIPPADARD